MWKVGGTKIERTQACYVVSSVRSSYSQPDLLLITTHLFRSHRSSTLDFHFLSHYSYIKAIMLYKGNHWTRCAGFMDASWVPLGITNDDLETTWGWHGDNLCTTLAYFGILWHTMAYSGILWCDVMQHGATQCKMVQYHAKPCNSMQKHTIQCNPMLYHAIPCIIDNCWRSVPLPCGQ